MNLVDSCGWLEYFCGTDRANLFAAALEDTANLVVPTVCIYEVCKKILHEMNEQAALQAVASMRQAQLIPFDDSLAISAALLSRRYKIPMADAIVMASARNVDAIIWTQDRHFENIPGVKFFPK
jgi:predicted nucleic acid-binding protein